MRCSPLSRALYEQGEQLKDLQQQIPSMEYFKRVEQDSELVSRYQSDEYFVIRMDGIGLSKKYLSNVTRDKKFEGLMWESLEETFKVLHRKCPHDSQNFILAASICSDEVSIVLSKVPTYYENRVIKLLTTFSSTFTSFFTGKGITRAKKKSQPICGAFDGRALILKSQDEVVEYLATRYAVNVRNSYTKLLRLDGVSSDEIYSKENYNNIEYIQEKIDERGLTDKASGMYLIPKFFVSNKRELKNYSFSSVDEMKRSITSSIVEHESWLEQLV